MLGWEFPPLFAGGLGVATYGIVKALSKKTKVKLIIPAASDAIPLDDVNIIGLNRLTAEEIDLERLKASLSFANVEIHKLPITVSPYHHINDLIRKHKLDQADDVWEHHKKSISFINDIFSDHEVYGGNIMHKVHLFAALAEELAAKDDFDVIHAHDWITYPAGLTIKKRTNKPLVLHVHALETDRAGHDTRNEIYWMERNAMLVADRVIAVSQFTKDQIVQHYDIEPSKISIVHNGIEPVETHRKQNPMNDKLVAFLGRITNQKGPQFLLETAEKVSRVYPKVKFIVAGTGDQFAHLLETSAYKRIGSKFIFTGFLSKAKVNELLSMADVYFMPSVSEPFGLTALEAAQYNVPSVLSMQSGVAEVMHSSLKADFWDTDKFTNYIYALLKYNTLSKELSEKAKQELNMLTWHHAADKVNAIYSEVYN